MGDSFSKRPPNHCSVSSGTKRLFKTPNNAAKRLLDVIKLLETQNIGYNNSQMSSYSCYSDYSDQSQNHDNYQIECFNLDSPTSDQLVSNIPNHHSSHKMKRRPKNFSGLKVLSHNELMYEISNITKQADHLDKKFQKMNNNFGFTF